MVYKQKKLNHCLTEWTLDRSEDTQQFLLAIQRINNIIS